MLVVEIKILRTTEPRKTGRWERWLRARLSRYEPVVLIRMAANAFGMVKWDGGYIGEPLVSESGRKLSCFVYMPYEEKKQ